DYFERLNDFSRKVRGINKTFLFVSQAHCILQKENPMRQVHLANTHITRQFQLSLVITLSNIISILGFFLSQVPN
ncbi:MAG: hypothetical protein ACK56I_27475, partial [bacterium]